QLLVELLPALENLGVDLLERRRAAVDVDEDDIPPDMAADPDQAQLRCVHIWMRVPPKAAAMRRRAELAVQAVGPAMVGAADGAADLGGRCNQDHAAMAAGILENADAAIPVAHEQKRHSEEVDRPGIAGFENVLAEPDAGPVREQDRPLLLGENAGIDVMFVGQAVGEAGFGHDGSERDGGVHWSV